MTRKGEPNEKMKLDDINKNIEKNKREVNNELRMELSKNERCRTKERTKEKQELLDKITEATIENAKAEGKFKSTGDRRIYYDPS